MKLLFATDYVLFRASCSLIWRPYIAPQQAKQTRIPVSSSNERNLEFLPLFTFHVQVLGVQQYSRKQVCPCTFGIHVIGELFVLILLQPFSQTLESSGVIL